MYTKIYQVVFRAIFGRLSVYELYYYTWRRCNEPITSSIVFFHCSRLCNCLVSLTVFGIFSLKILIVLWFFIFSDLLQICPSSSLSLSSFHRYLLACIVSFVMFLGLFTRLVVGSSASEIISRLLLFSFSTVFSLLNISSLYLVSSFAFALFSLSSFSPIFIGLSLWSLISVVLLSLY